MKQNVNYDTIQKVSTPFAFCGFNPKWYWRQFKNMDL